MTTPPASLYASPSLECDIVMKGGITSGVIYPQAVSELAKTYTLRSVGGASAGAIAAAAAAAAELGRATGGFEELDRMPADLTLPGPDGRSTLATFFQPTPTAAPLFRLLHATEGKAGGAAMVAAIMGLLRGYARQALLGALPGIVLFVLGVVALVRGIADGSSGLVIVVVLLGMLVALLVTLVGAAVGVVLGAKKTVETVAEQGFGLCTGMPGVESGQATALTPWLYDKFQSIAGRGSGAPPVTFGDLAAKGITLKMMTTNLTRHQPMAMPWKSREYYFDPVLMRTLFPDDVVDAMLAHPPGLPPGPAAAFDVALFRAQAAPLRPWPEAEHLPIVVATRMSLSFPVLISAVRLEAVDYTLPANRVARDAVAGWRQANPGGTVEQALAVLPAPTFSPVWFTDGGLCANLPVHFFDTPLPKRPSFAFNLSAFPPGQTKSADQANNSHLPLVNQGGATRPWFGLKTRGLGAWVDFVMLMFGTARSWVDGEQLIMPGYRDRIVTVFSDDSEGGMNLSMPAQVVTDLSLRGKLGATKLVDAFAGAQPGVVPAHGWDNHRWIRFRTATAGLNGWLTTFGAGYQDRSSGGTAYADLAGPGAQAELPSYHPTVGDRALINSRTGELLTMAQDWAGDDAMTRSAPTPRPQLRLVPDDGSAAGLTAATGGAPTNA